MNVCDSWFFALDGQRVGNGSGSWLIHVTAVRSLDDYYWIQLEEAGNPMRSVVLRVAPDATVEHVIATLMMVDSEHVADFVPVSDAA